MLLCSSNVFIIAYIVFFIAYIAAMSIPYLVPRCAWLDLMKVIQQDGDTDKFQFVLLEEPILGKVMSHYGSHSISFFYRLVFPFFKKNKVDTY